MSGLLNRLLRPKFIAVLGGREAEYVVEQCGRLGFGGDIWPVHPSKQSVGGHPAYRSLDDLPGPPDAVYIGVNRLLTIDLVRQLATMGAGGAVCYASGFREADGETGDGAGLQDELVTAAGDMPILGPNCFGFINALDRAVVWPDQQGTWPVERGVAIVSQSSNMAINMTMQNRGLPIAYVLAAGNQAQIGLSDLALDVLEDDRVTALGLHIEGLDDLVKFGEMALRARTLKKPVVALKVGRSHQSQAAVVSHTASLTGSEAGADALFRRLGIARVGSLPAFLETLKLLHVHGPLPGRNLCSMSCSGGEASMMADAAVDRNVNFRALTSDEAAGVKATLNNIVTVANPLDYHTFIWGDGYRMQATYGAMMACGFDLSMLIYDEPDEDRCDPSGYRPALEAFERAVAATGARAALVTTLSENIAPTQVARLMDTDVVPLMGIEEALDAARAAADIGEAWMRREPAPLLGTAMTAGDAVTLDEVEAKSRLTACGLAAPRGRVVTSPAEAASVAAEIGFPVALKALGIAHKTEARAVQLNLQTANTVERVATALSDHPRLLVEAMINDAVCELLVGVSHDPLYGPMLTIAAGGTLVELLEDSATLLLPATPEDIRAAVLSLRTAPLLSGYRSRPAGDLDAAVDAVRAIADFAVAHAAVLVELDINPLMVRPPGYGAVVADALIRIRE